MCFNTQSAFLFLKYSGEDIKMSTRHKVDDDHYRVVSDDGRKSELYEKSFFGDTRIEVADHGSNGETTAYEADNGFFGFLTGGRGDKK